MANYINSVDLYLNDNGDVGFLYSPGYGAGWSTWNGDHEEIAYDKRVIEKFIEDPDLFHNYKDVFGSYSPRPLDEFMRSLGYERGYYGGAEDLKLVFIPKGVMFRVHEYDGSESIVVFDPSDYICF